VLFARDLITGGSDLAFSGQIILWLWFTLIFANFIGSVGNARSPAPMIRNPVMFVVRSWRCSPRPVRPRPHHRRQRSRLLRPDHPLVVVHPDLRQL
ncbi:hypothetical protein CTI14_62345, partial [Methylobacterium radiotolerans]